MTLEELQKPVTQVEVAKLVEALAGFDHQKIVRRMAFELDRLRSQVGRKCECGALVDDPENTLCGGCS